MTPHWRIKAGKMRALIVDDSGIVHKWAGEVFSGKSDIEVVGTALDPYTPRLTNFWFSLMMC